MHFGVLTFRRITNKNTYLKDIFERIMKDLEFIIPDVERLQLTT